MRKFDMGEAWQQVAAMFRGNREILVTVAGLFLFLPTVIFALVYGDPPEPAAGASSEHALSLMMGYYQQVAPGLMLTAIVSMVGNLTIWRLLLAPGGTSLGGALTTALTLSLSYFAASFLSAFPLMLGFLLLIVPGFYLMARFILIGPVMTAENIMNPINAISTSWNYTRNNGWIVLLFVLIVAVVGAIGITIANTIFGGLFALVLPENIANILKKVIESALSAGFTLVMTLAVASIYRQLSPIENVKTFS